MDKSSSTGSFQPKQSTWALWLGLVFVTHIAFAAFGAHALKDRLGVAQLSSYETAVTFHQYFALLMLIYHAGIRRWGMHRLSRAFQWGVRLVAAGFIVFCGSLYLLSTRELTGFGQAYVLGPITPLGGLLMMVGFGLCAISLYLHLRRSSTKA